MRRTLVLCCLIVAAILAAAPAAVAHGGMVTEPSAIEVVGGEHVELAMHGDRIPPGSDEALTRRARVLPRLAAAALPTTWCGTQRTTDDTANASHQGPRIKIVYAYPYDQPNRFDSYKDLIQSDVAAVTQWVANSTGGARTLRFDTGTSCGADYVDVAVLRLPRTRDAYVNDPNRAGYVIDDVREAPLGLGGTRDVLVYADTLYAGDGVVGTAQMPEDDSAGAANDANLGGAVAMIWGDGTAGFVEDRLTTFLHEMSHNLGAVQDSAPNSTLGGHCYEMFDVMCYADGGPRGTGDWLFLSCSMTELLPYECGGDDYINPAPAPGTYLATHWNLYDSAFMCAVGSCVVPKAPTPTPTPTPTPEPAPAPAPTPEPAPPAPDPGTAVSEEARLWLDGFVTTGVTSLRKLGLSGLARGRSLVVTGQAPNGHAVQLDLMLGAAAIGGGALDTTGRARIKLSRTYRRGLARMRKARLTLQGVIRSAAGGGPPTVKRVTVTLKAPKKKKKKRRR